jgi:hypothetical protein
LKNNVSVTYSTVGKAIHDRHGYFFWKVLFQTTGKNGWIVQRIQNEFEGTKSDGSPDLHTPTKEYWEAWRVDENSVISPSNLNAHDKWQRGYEGAGGVGTTGSFSMKGDVYFTQKDITKNGFAQNSVPDAGNLYATTKKPKGLGDVLLSRFANGKWDSTNGKLEFSGTHG